MAKPIPPALKKHAFKPGQSGNPEGSRLHNPLVRAFSKMSVETFRRVLEVILTGNRDDLNKIIKDKKSTNLELAVATAMVNAIREGDYGVVERIAERIIGKIPDQLNVKSEGVLDVSIDPAKLRAALKKIKSEV